MAGAGDSLVKQYPPATHQFLGKALGTPVCNLLGGPFRDEIPLSFSLANPDLAADVEMAKRLYGEGLRIFKVKTGAAGHAEDLRRLEILRAELADDVDLRVDYNQALDVFDAIPKLRDVEAFRPTFIEQPVDLHRLDAMAEIARALDTPIMADESVFSPADALAVAGQRAADIISIKVMKGGTLNVRRISAVAQAAGIPCYGGDMAESGLGHLAGAHVIAATPTSRSAASSTRPPTISRRTSWPSPSPSPAARSRCRPRRASASRWTRTSSPNTPSSA